MNKSDSEKLLGAHFTYAGCPFVTMEISGNCPVQAFGKISDGKPDKFYFRARHDNWDFEVYDGENENKIIFHFGGEYSNASWMSIDDALTAIGESVRKFWKEIGAFRRIARVWDDDLLKKFKEGLNDKSNAPRSN